MRRSTCIFLLLVGFIMTTGCHSKSYVSEKLFWKAEQLVKSLSKNGELTEQDYEKIVPAYRRIVKAAPGTELAGKADLVVAQIYLSQGKKQEAMETFKKVTQDYFRNTSLAPQAYMWMGKIHEIDKKWEDAENIYRDVIDFHPLTETGLRLPFYVSAYYKKNKSTEEYNRICSAFERHYKGLIKKYSGTSIEIGLKNQLANFYLSQEHWKDAIRELSEIVDSHLEYKEGLMALGMIGRIYVSNLKDIEGAVTVYTDAIERISKPEVRAFVQFELAGIYFVNARYAEAESLYREILGGKKDAIDNSVAADFYARSEVMLAGTRDKQGDWSEAEKILRQVETECSKTKFAVEIPYMIAKHYSEGGQKDKADGLFQEALEKYTSIMQDKSQAFPVIYDAKVYAILSYIALQQWNHAIAALEQVIETYPRSPQVPSQYMLLANIYLQNLKQPKKAISVYERFLEKFPTHALASSIKTHMAQLSAMDAK